MGTRVRSHAKINLGLAVGPARADGFHGLTTIYQTLALYDFVTVSARRAATTSIQITSDHPGVPRSETGDAERNTAYKMVAAALKRLAITAEVSIDIAKKLPVQGGLGAGSANAVAALLGLERELAGLGIGPLPSQERLALAAKVGSDVPLFLLGGTVLGLGRGEEVYPLPDSAPLACVLALPEVGVSTAQAFRDLDAQMGDGAAQRQRALTLQPLVDKLRELSHAQAAVGIPTGAESGPSGIASSEQSMDTTSDLAEIPGFPSNLLDGMVNPLLALVRTGMENDFEEVVFSQHPSLRSTKRDLAGTADDGALYAAIYTALSGSGSALFALYESQTAARAAQHRVQSNGTRAILTETLARHDYWNTMFAE